MKKILFSFLIFISVNSFSQKLLCDTLFVKDPKIHWKYTGSLKVDTFFVQQLRWDKWVKVGKVKADSSQTIYECNVVPHFGENQFRLNCQLKTGKFVVSQEIKYSNPQDTNYNEPYGKRDSVYFPKKCKWEIYDKLGNIVKKGEGDRFGIKDLVPDVYYLNYNNHTIEFIRHKKGQLFINFGA